MSVFNERLQELKEESGIQSKDIAEALNISQSKVSYYMRGAGEPPYDLLNKFADYFKVTADYLTGHSNQKNLKSEITVDAIKSTSGNTTKNAERVADVEKKTEVFYNALIRLADIEADNKDKYDDIWESIDIWSEALNYYCIYLQASNTSYPIDEAKKTMDTLSKARSVAGNRIIEMLRAICTDDTGSVPSEIKKRVVMHSSFGIRSINALDDSDED